MITNETRVIDLTVFQLQQLIGKIVKNSTQNTEQTPTVQQELLTIEELSKLVHLTIRTIYGKKSRGEIPGVCKPGKRLFFEREAIIKWIKDGRPKTNAETEGEAEKYLKKRGGKK